GAGGCLTPLVSRSRMFPIRESGDPGQQTTNSSKWPLVSRLRTDPFERADHEEFGYPTWRLDRTFLVAPAGAYVGQWLRSFREFPPRQKPGSSNLSEVMDKLSAPRGSN